MSGESYNTMLAGVCLGRTLATFNSLQLKHPWKLRFSSVFYTTFYTVFILPLTTSIRLWKDKKTL